MSRTFKPNQLFHNNGDGTFSDVIQKAGGGDPGLCLVTVFGDDDDDGYPDHHNNRNRTFSDLTVKAGAPAYGAGMSASFGDYDNDGRLDIYCTNIRSEQRLVRGGSDGRVHDQLVAAGSVEDGYATSTGRCTRSRASGSWACSSRWLPGTRFCATKETAHSKT